MNLPAEARPFARTVRALRPWAVAALALTVALGASGSGVATPLGGSADPRRLAGIAPASQRPRASAPGPSNRGGPRWGAGRVERPRTGAPARSGVPSAPRVALTVDTSRVPQRSVGAVRNTLKRIEQGATGATHNDGIVFANRERRLPEGHYREYPLVGRDGRVVDGVQRLVVSRDGRVYWTGDHYRTFRRIDTLSH